MSDIEHKRNLAKKLEDGNQRSYVELQEEVAKHGGRFPGMDTGDARRETFFEMLVEWGIVSEEQFLEFEIAFHTRVDEALQAQWASLKEQIAEFEKRKTGLSVVKNPDVLLGPNGQPITGGR